MFPAVPEEFEGIWRGYFDLDTDYAGIRAKLTAGDDVMKSAAGNAPGIRLLNQDPWECLISFIISQNNNIPRIKKIIESISKKYGEAITDGVYAFPSPEALEKAEIPDYMECGTGFRAKYIADAVKRVNSGELNMDKLSAMTTGGLSIKLMEVYGVGRKVSDCVALFSYGRRELFPVDVWVKRVMEHFYFGGNSVRTDEIHKLASERFGGYAGYAQQYLFHYARQFDGFKK